MADTRLGKIGITVKEPWAADISYEVLDMSLFAVENGGDGCSYVALRNNIGVTPGTDPNTWVKSTQAGQSIYDLAVKYHHFVGTEEEFEAEYQAALQAARDAAAGASAVEAQVEAAEALRVAAETGRANAESARQSAEASRASAETARGTAEAARQSAESGRASAETARVTAEQGRASAESDRVSAEAARTAAEADRVSDFSALRTDMQTAIGQADAATAAAVATNNQIQTAETGRVSAEQGRVSAETARASAEQARAAAETARVTAEGQRASAETQRATAEQARATAETARETQTASDHTRAESDHSTASGDHTQAGTDHSTALADHVTASADHETWAGYRVVVKSVGDTAPATPSSGDKWYNTTDNKIYSYDGSAWDSGVAATTGATIVNSVTNDVYVFNGSGLFNNQEEVSQLGQEVNGLDKSQDFDFAIATGGVDYTKTVDVKAGKYNITVDDPNNALPQYTILFLNGSNRGYVKSITNPLTISADVTTIRLYANETATNSGDITIHFEDAEPVPSLRELSNEANENAQDAVEDVATLGQEILHSYVIGKGQDFTFKYFYGFTPGQNIAVYLKSTDWDTTGITGQGISRFAVRAFDSEGGSLGDIVFVALNEANVKHLYTATIPDGCAYIYAGGRAVEGVKIEFDIINVPSLGFLRHEHLALGFTSAPINIDNVNSKFKWNSNIYFNLNASMETYRVAPGELSFASYSGANTCLGLCLELTNTSAGSGLKVANLFIAGNGASQSPNVFNNYIVAYFFRSGTYWAAGPVVSVYSDLPFTIDGVRYPNDREYIDNLTYDSSFEKVETTVGQSGKKLNWNGSSSRSVVLNNDSSYNITNSIYLEKGEIVFIKAYGQSNVISLCKVDGNNYTAGLLCCSGISGSIIYKTKYYFIQETGYYVICYNTTYLSTYPLIVNKAKNLPVYLNYNNLFTILGINGVRLNKTNFSKVIEGVVTGSSIRDRIRLYAPITKGSSISVTCTLGKGVAVSIYQNESQIPTAGQDYLQTLSFSYVASVQGVSNYDGYLVVSLAKNDDSEFTDQEILDYIAATTISVINNNGIEKQIENLSIKEQKELFIGTLLQKALTADGLTDTNKDYRVSTATCMVVPKEQAKLKFKLPKGYYIGIRNGDQSRNLSVNSFWFGNEDTFTFGSNVHYFRFCFVHFEGAFSSSTVYLPITVQEVNELIAAGEIKIFVEDWENDIIKQNFENEKYLKAVMRNFVSGASNNGSLHKLPIFAHTSDVHGDANRFESFAKFCDYIGVDAALVSGDVVATDPVDSMQYINDIMDSHNTKILLSTGNHDTVGLQTAQGQYETIMGHCIEKYSGIVTNPSETYPTYYYYDFADKNIRLISINLYETDHADHQCKFTQAQCEWLIATLAATPANYGVLIMFHSPEARPSKDANYATFYQDILNWTGYHVGLSGNVFRSIIDAFIGKTSATITYTSKGESITVSADFTNVASGVEFIAWVNGHLHVDEVGYIPGATHKQLNLNVNCGVAVYGSTYRYLANNSDLPRGCDGATQDCFNIYAIDRDAKTVRIAKVGSNVSGDLKERKFMSIPYAD